MCCRQAPVSQSQEQAIEALRLEAEASLLAMTQHGHTVPNRTLMGAIATGTVDITLIAVVNLEDLHVDPPCSARVVQQHLIPPRSASLGWESLGWGDRRMRASQMAGCWPARSAWGGEREAVAL